MDTKKSGPDPREGSGRWRAQSLANQALYGLHAAIMKLEKLAFLALLALAALGLQTCILSDTAQTYQSMCR